LSYSNAHRGRFIPTNPQKYAGNPKNIIFRSSWEKKCMKRFDTDPNIITWASEELSIPYIDPIGRKRRRYFPDFIIKYNDADGKLRIAMIEVKPLRQTKEPKKRPSGRRTRKYLKEVVTYRINTRKWEAAKAYCENHGWDWIIATEVELGIK